MISDGSKQHIEGLEDVETTQLENNINIIDLIILSKAENSKSEIRRLIKGKAIKINDSVVSDEKFIINQELFSENYLKLSIGKKRHIKIELSYAEYHDWDYLNKLLDKMLCQSRI